MPPTRPFSKLKKQIENLFVPDLKMTVNCISYPVRSQYGSSSIPRFYVKLGKEIIWDFPKDFEIKNIEFHTWVYKTGISDLIREYVDAPVSGLLEKEFSGERLADTVHVNVKESETINYDFKLGLTDLFKAADRRIGRDKLLQWRSEKSQWFKPSLDKVIDARFYDYKIFCETLDGWNGMDGYQSKIKIGKYHEKLERKI